MDFFIEYAGEQAAAAIGHTWRWFNTLNREEWLVVLGATCALGFLFIRGFGSQRVF